MKTILDWMRKHPFLVTAYSVVFSSLATAMAFRDDWKMVGCILYGLLAICLGFSLWRHRVVAVTALLVIGLAAAVPIQAQEEEEEETMAAPAACAAAAVAVVVVVVGGYCVFKIVKFCQKHFPKEEAKEDGEEEEEGGGGGSTDSYAAAFNFAEMGSCAEGWPCSDQHVADGSGGGGALGSLGTTTVINLRLLRDAEGEITFLSNITSSKSTNAVQNFNDFAQEVAKHGVHVTGTSGVYEWSKNGQPCDGTQTPIKWDPVRKIAVVNPNKVAGYEVTVWRSSDLQEWTQLLKTEIGLDVDMRVCDTEVSSQHFYRFEAVLAD